MRPIPMPSREMQALLTLTLCILAAAYSHQANLLVFIVTLIFAPIVASIAWGRRNLASLTVVRQIPEGAFADEELAGGVEVTNTRRWLAAFAVTAVEQYRVGPRIINIAIPLPVLGAGQSYRQSFTVRLKRGVYRFGPIVLHSRFPLGFWGNSATAADTCELFVYPRLGTLTPLWRRSNAPQPGLAQSVNRGGVGPSGDYHGLREYRGSDNPRHIHWRTSARRGQLMIREFDREHSPDLILLVSTKVLDDENRLESCLRMAATVCVDCCQRSLGRLTLGVVGTDVTLHHAPATVRNRDGFLRLLAAAQPAPMSDWTGCLAQLAPRYLPGTPIWILGGDADACDSPMIRARLGIQSASERVFRIDPRNDGLDPWFLDTHDD